MSLTTIVMNPKIFDEFDDKISRFNGWLQKELEQPPLTSHEKAMIKTYLVYAHDHENVPTK